MDKKALAYNEICRLAKEGRLESEVFSFSPFGYTYTVEDIVYDCNTDKVILSFSYDGKSVFHGRVLNDFVDWFVFDLLKQIRTRFGDFNLF